ncbi:hypothetical protein [Pseudoxanthomonas sp.]|jgi:hypothetical protein|uniref:hypothetical protein n=1 Tax=Pseudoxanthomonas sp. TaxID=1871049 RepID=UPI002FE3D920
MPWTQDHLIPALNLLPTCLEPEDEIPNFHRLKLRIAVIERQHFILSLQEWVEVNAHWLGTHGLRLHSGRQDTHDGPSTLTYFERFDDKQAHTGIDTAERDEQVDRLIALLDLHSTPINEAFIGLTVEDLNHIRWDPQHFRQVLAFKIADIVPDAYTWLGRHSAAGQAKSLRSSTAPLRPGPSRPRL